MLNILPILKTLLRHKTGPLLIVIQLALTIAIVSNAMFVIQQRLQTINQPAGFDKTALVALRVSLDRAENGLKSVIPRDLELLRQIPGVQAASATSSIPMSGDGQVYSVSTRPDGEEGGRSAAASSIYTDSNFVSTMNTPLAAGRNFRKTEEQFVDLNNKPDAGAIILTQAVADELFPNEPAQGKLVYFGGFKPVTVVGVLEHMQGLYPHWDLSDQVAVMPTIENDSQHYRYLIRATPEQRQQVLDAAMEKLNAEPLPRFVHDPLYVEDIVNKVFSSDYAMVTLLSIVVALLVFVNALGVIGITSFWVSQRRRVIGIRRALGATRGAITGYFLVENTLLIIMSGLLGAALAAVLSGYMVQAHSLKPVAPYLVVLTLIFIWLVSAASAYVPALRAAQGDPVCAVREK